MKPFNQRNMSSLSVLLATLLLASTTLSDSVNHCLTYDKLRNECTECFRQAPDGESGLCHQIFRPIYKCDIYIAAANSQQYQCSQCAPNYYLDENYRSKERRCFQIPDSAQLCILGVKLLGRFRCLACQYGYFKDHTTTCIPASQVPGADPNCLWGVFQNYCLRCKDGYYVKTTTNKCEAWTKSVGCLKYNDQFNTCAICNGYEGYWMNKDGVTCSRTPMSAQPL